MLDVAWGTTAGTVYAVRGDTGAALPNFPVALGRAAAVRPALRAFTFGEGGEGGRGTTVLAAGCADGFVALVALPTGCVDRVDLGDARPSAMFLGDFSARGGLELLVASGTGHAHLLATDALFHPLQAWHARAKGPGVQHVAREWLGAHFSVSGSGERLVEEVQGGADVTLRFDITDERKPTLQGRAYAVRVQLDAVVLLSRTYTAPGRYEEVAALPEGAARGRHLLTLRMRNELGQESGDAMAVTLEPRTERVVRWLVLLPLALLFALLMLVREAPDLLPQ